MQWWCSAQGVAWTWSWRPYVGVWVLVGLLVLAYVKAVPPAEAVARPRAAAFAGGLFCLWAALDWPIGALAAGYLASLHMVQFLLVGVVAPPLLLLGVPPGSWERLARRGRAVRLLRAVTHPLVAIAVFNLIVAFTHWPAVVDGLMGAQLGSFAIDMLWFAGGVVFWWPVVAPVPARPGFGYPLKIGYLILNTILNTGPFIYLTFSGHPVYATYELAPAVEWISKGEDQRLAGLLMKMGAGLVLWVGISTLFFRWYLAEEGPLSPRPMQTANLTERGSDTYQKLRRADG